MTTREWVRSRGWLMLAALALYESGAAWHSITGDPNAFQPIFRPKYIAHLGLVIAHSTSSIVALATGPFLLRADLRRRFASCHRRLGYAYLLGTLVGSVTGLQMGTMAEGGLSSRIGFVLMAALWLVTGAMALVTARARRFAAHRRWVLRSYALTFGAVMLRLYLHALEELGYDFQDVYPYVTWMGWIPNLLLVEAVLSSERRRD